MNRWVIKTFAVVLVVASIATFLLFDLEQFLNPNLFKNQIGGLQDYYHQHPSTAIAVYAVAYISTTALSLPGAAAMTLLGGALFGTITGTIIVSFCSTIGATLAFLVARFFLNRTIVGRFGAKLEIINLGLVQGGAFYLFAMRLIPVIPFFAINSVMGLTSIRTVHFFFVSQLGMLPGTIVYINAGMQITRINSLNTILSPTLLLSFVLVGLFPLFAKKSIELISKRRCAKRA